MVVEADDIELVGPDGETVDLPGRTKILLCRCGASENRPLGDGSHDRLDFEQPTDDP